MKGLDYLVIELIKEHGGGEKFFNALDSLVASNDYFQMLLKKAEEIRGTNMFNIVVSGKFGNLFSNWANFYLPKGYSILNVNGSLREGAKLIDIQAFINEIVARHYSSKFIFLDDSYYSGKTESVIKQALEKAGASLLKTIVVYDGSKIQSPSVQSLYRYYDNYPLEDKN